MITANRNRTGTGKDPTGHKAQLKLRAKFISHLVEFFMPNFLDFISIREAKVPVLRLHETDQQLTLLVTTRHKHQGRRELQLPDSVQVEASPSSQRHN